MVRFSRSVGVLAVVAALGACGGESKRSGATNGAAGTGVTSDPASAGQGSGDDTGANTVGGSATKGGNGDGVGGIGGVGGSSGLGGMNASGGSGGTTDGIEPGGCPADDLSSCSPGPDRVCTSSECGPGDLSTFGVDERGDGTICKFLPDSAGPDFACLRGEWCQVEVHVCRCGAYPGCQVGETCTICTRGDCQGDYHCQRDIACTEDNLDSCGAEPGQTCPTGSHACTEPEQCPDMTQGDGATVCANAPGGCCPKNHWCFDGRECRCGAHPACSDGEECALDYREFYACRAP